MATLTPFFAVGYTECGEYGVENAQRGMGRGYD